MADRTPTLTGKTMRRALGWRFIALLLTSAAFPVAAQPSRVAPLFPTAVWAAFSGQDAPGCQTRVPIDTSARPWGPTGSRLGTYDVELWAARYAGGRANFDCLRGRGWGAQCDVYHATAGTLELQKRVAAAVGVPWDSLTMEEQTDAAFGNACAGSGSGHKEGVSCAAPALYRGTPRASLRCQYFQASGKCWKWTGAPATAPTCCPGVEVLGCPPGGTVEPPPPPPELMCDGGAPDKACTPRELAAGTCPEDCVNPPPGCAPPPELNAAIVRLEEVAAAIRPERLGSRLWTAIADVLRLYREWVTTPPASTGGLETVVRP